MSNSNFQIFFDTRREYRFRLRAGNNEIILHSSEGYTTKQSCLKGIASVKVNAPLDSRYVRASTVNKEHYFALRAANSETLGMGERYSTRFNRDQGIEVVKREAPAAGVQDLTETTTSRY